MSWRERQLDTIAKDCCETSNRIENGLTAHVRHEDSNSQTALRVLTYEMTGRSMANVDTHFV